jgi:hypothetical protein
MTLVVGAGVLFLLLCFGGLIAKDLPAFKVETSQALQLPGLGCPWATQGRPLVLLGASV